MKDVKTITFENHMEVIHGLTYGINLVSFENEKVRKEVHHKIEILNAYFDTSAIEDKEAVDIELEDGSFAFKVEGVRNLLYKRSYSSIPVLHGDNYIGEKVMNETTSDSGISRRLMIDPKLRKYYRNLGNIFNVKFIENRFDASNRFGGKPKRVGGGVAAQIKEAYLNGEKSICFSSYRSNPQSIRNAASALGKMVNRKFSVEIHGYEIFVIFRDLSSSEKDEMIFKNLILTMRKNDNKERITALFHEFLDMELPKEELEEIEGQVNLETEPENNKIVYKQDIYDDDEF